jgi:hypothetical protein
LPEGVQLFVSGFDSVEGQRLFLFDLEVQIESVNLGS